MSTSFAHLEQHWHDSRVPVIGNERALLAGPEGQQPRRLNGRLTKYAEAPLVVNEVRTRLGAVQLAAGRAPYLAVMVADVDCSAEAVNASKKACL